MSPPAEEGEERELLLANFKAPGFNSLFLFLIPDRPYHAGSDSALNYPDVESGVTADGGRDGGGCEGVVVRGAGGDFLW